MDEKKYDSYTVISDSELDNNSSDLDDRKLKNVNNKKNKNKIFVVVIICVFLLIVFWGLLIINKPEQKDDDENVENNSSDNSNKVELIDSTQLFSFSGVYSKGNITVKIYANNMSGVELLLFADNSVNFYSLDFGESNNLVYDYNSFGRTEKINIEKTTNGINITASSSESDSVLNRIDGFYYKSYMSTSGWTGLYDCGDFNMILDEYESNLLNIAFIKDNSRFQTNTTDVTYEYISISGMSFDDKYSINLEKASGNILVTASSSESDSLLNEIDGICKKI